MEERQITDKREKEKKIVHEMIALYCRKQHGTSKAEGLCPNCQMVYDYAAMRTDKCPFMDTKTFCSNCKVHCYKPEMREKIREIMRFSGPRMLFYHPVLAVSHLVEDIKEKKTIQKQENKAQKEKKV